MICKEFASLGVTRTEFLKQESAIWFISFSSVSSHSARKLCRSSSKDAIFLMVTLLANHQILSFKRKFGFAVASFVIETYVQFFLHTLIFLEYFLHIDQVKGVMAINNFLWTYSYNYCWNCNNKKEKKQQLEQLWVKETLFTPTTTVHNDKEAGDMICKVKRFWTF